VAVEQHDAVAGGAHRRGRDRAIDRHAVVIEPLAEVDERGDRLVDRLRIQLAARERVVAEPHRHPLGLDPDQLHRRELGDHDPDRVRAGIDRAEPQGSHEETLSRWLR
jgi:hypothetical protein